MDISFREEMMIIVVICVVRLWDLDSFELIGSTPADSNQVKAIAFSSLGSAICSAGKDTLKIWQLEPTVSFTGYLMHYHYVEYDIL